MKLEVRRMGLDVVARQDMHDVRCGSLPGHEARGGSLPGHA